MNRSLPAVEHNLDQPTLEDSSIDPQVQVEQTTAALRESEDRFRCIFEQSAAGILECDQDAARTLSLLVKSYGHETAVAYDGRLALEAAEQFRPAVALLDLGLPEINGFDLAAIFQRKHPEMHLVAISGYGQATDLERSQAAGFAEHFVKPVKLEDLVSLLSKRATAALVGSSLAR